MPTIAGGLSDRQRATSSRGAAPSPASPVPAQRGRGQAVGARGRSAENTTRPQGGEGPRGGRVATDDQGPLGTSRINEPSRLRGAADFDRRERYFRRSQSSRWLIADAIQAKLPNGIEEVEQGVFVDTVTGELHDPEWVRPPRVARCSWRIGEQVAVHGDGGGRAHFSGAERCGSIWSCPVCASVIRPERAQEITQAVEGHQSSGGSVVFVTLTLRHRRTDALATTLDAALSGWGALMRHRRWRGKSGMKQLYAISGYIRATEVTYGQSGWHPHLHVLLMTDRALSDVELSALGDDVHDFWADYAQRATGRRPTRAHGIDVQRVDTEGKILAQYLGKVQEKSSADERKRWTAAAELARGDVKQARGGGASVAPFQLLDDETDLPAPMRRRLWAEYVEATHGRRAITWSRGLKQRYGVGERSDEEIMDDVQSAPARWLASRESYDRARREDGGLRLAMALEAAERDDWSKVARLLPGQPADPEHQRPAEHLEPSSPLLHHLRTKTIPQRMTDATQAVEAMVQIIDERGYIPDWWSV